MPAFALTKKQVWNAKHPAPHHPNFYLVAIALKTAQQDIFQIRTLMYAKMLLIQQINALESIDKQEIVLALLATIKIRPWIVKNVI